MEFTAVCSETSTCFWRIMRINTINWDKKPLCMNAVKNLLNMQYKRQDYMSACCGGSSGKEHFRRYNVVAYCLCKPISDYRIPSHKLLFYRCGDFHRIPSLKLRILTYVCSNFIYMPAQKLYLYRYFCCIPSYKLHLYRYSQFWRQQL
jgi:hypothetical protein